MEETETQLAIVSTGFGLHLIELLDKEAPWESLTQAVTIAAGCSLLNDSKAQLL